jgi:hypothetical protein
MQFNCNKWHALTPSAQHAGGEDFHPQPAVAFKRGDAIPASKLHVCPALISQPSFLHTFAESLLLCRP